MTLQRFFIGLALVLMACTVRAQVPDIELRDLEGKPRNVNEFIGHGKWTIVSVWAHDCAVCEKEIGEMAAFHTANRDRNAIVLGVSIDGMAQRDLAQKFVARHTLPFVNLVAEPEQDVIGKFGGGAFIGTPTHYFYDPRGRIVGRKIGPMPRADLEEFIEVFNKSPYAVR
ncbi:MAG: TlpA disulfide reductase family protein [Thiobacillus sp.]